MSHPTTNDRSRRANSNSPPPQGARDNPGGVGAAGGRDGGEQSLVPDSFHLFRAYVAYDMVELNIMKERQRAGIPSAGGIGRRDCERKAMRMYEECEELRIYYNSLGVFTYNDAVKNVDYDLEDLPLSVFSDVRDHITDAIDSERTLRFLSNWFKLEAGAPTAAPAAETATPVPVGAASAAATAAVPDTAERTHASTIPSATTGLVVPVCTLKFTKRNFEALLQNYGRLSLLSTYIAATRAIISFCSEDEDILSIIDHSGPGELANFIQTKDTVLNATEPSEFEGFKELLRSVTPI